MLRAEPAVGIPEVLDPGHAESLGAAVQLGHPPVGEGASCGVLRGRQAELAVSRDDDDDPVTLRRGARQRPRRQEGLVVGVGVERQQCVSHVVDHFAHDMLGS